MRGLPEFENDEPTPEDTSVDFEEKLRREALKVDALQFETPTFWTNYIKDKSMTRKLENEERAKRKREEEEEERAMRKKQGKARCTDQRGSRLGVGFLMTPAPTPRKSKLGSSVLKSIEVDGMSDDGTGFVYDSRRFSDPFQSNGDGESDDPEDEEAEKARLEEARQSNLQSVRDSLPALVCPECHYDSERPCADVSFEGSTAAPSSSAESTPHSQRPESQLVNASS